MLHAVLILPKISFKGKDVYSMMFMRKYLFAFVVATVAGVGYARGAGVCVVLSCDKGYYVADNGYSCIRCPEAKLASGAVTYCTTKDAGPNRKTDCYLPAGDYKVEGGVFHVTTDDSCQCQ